MYYCASRAIYLFDYIYEFKELINSLKLTAHGNFGFSLWKHFKSTNVKQLRSVGFGNSCGS